MPDLSLYLSPRNQTRLDKMKHLEKMNIKNAQQTLGNAAAPNKLEQNVRDQIRI